MTDPSRSPASPGADREHYSYAHYANRDVAEGFDQLRFSGAIGRYLLEEQEALLLSVLSPLSDRVVLDVGTGTGRAAIGLARAGARVTGLDASAEMLDVARARAAAAHVAIRLGVADGHALPLADRSVDAAVCLRVLMHAIDWRQCLAELCRVSRSRVVVDFPAALSFAALESGVRRARQALGRPVEAYRVIAEKAVADAFIANGFKVVDVRRQFVLPINLHKAFDNLAWTRGLERGLASVGILRLLGSPVTMVAER